MVEIEVYFVTVTTMVVAFEAIPLVVLVTLTPYVPAFAKEELLVLPHPETQSPIKARVAMARNIFSR